MPALTVRMIVTSLVTTLIALAILSRVPQVRGFVGLSAPQ